MATTTSPLGRMVNYAIIGTVMIALGCGFQAAFAPTVRVTCPARTAAAPDCELRRFVAFDQIQVKHTPLPGLQPGNEIVNTAPGRKGGATTIFLKTSSGPVRSIMWGDHLSLQHDLRDPLYAYFENPQSPAIALTMRASRWVDPGGDADYRFVRKAHPVRLVANVMVVIGLLYWLAMPWQVLVFVVRGNRPATAET